MNLGHNSNVQVGRTAYHVQTEDRGSEHPFIDTTVYSGGHVVYRRTASYADLLKTDGDRQILLQKRVEDQHRTVIDEIRAGSLQLEASAVVGNASADSAAAAGASSAAVPASIGERIIVTLVNASSWIHAGHANLQIEVRSRETSQPKDGAKILVIIEGSLSPAQFGASTNAEGYVEVKFPLPKMSFEGGALVIRASLGSAHDQLRYHLKSKPRTPTPAQVP
ncbi:MAG TPA: hypothetical protein VOA41_12815 [Candidatus Dormibacteraeota bacterium]|nr:hypothetical protein [Candidatus Dormibacteraeota bacterium]